MRNLPEPLLSDLHSVPGFNQKPFIEAHQQAAVTSVRLHPLKNSGVFADNEFVPWCGAGRYLDTRPVFTLDPLFHAGAYYVQEASSMFLDHMLRSLLPQRNGLRVLDLCAAPGGKSTLIASLLDKESLLVSNEVIRTRASILEENMSRWGYMNTWVTSNDPRDFGKLTGYFDVIVVDAPCSGSGLFRKDLRALDEWSEANVALCSQRQQRILADVWPALKENGILVYATCSYSPQEDEEILDWLAEEFSANSLPVDVKPEWDIVTTISKRGMYGYRFFPDKVKGEGFFVGAVQKQEGEKEISIKFKTTHNKKVHQQAQFLLADANFACLETDKDQFNAIHPAHEVDLQLLKKAVYLRKTGIGLGMPTAKEWVPAHDVALSVDRSNSLPIIDVNREQALLFLKKEDIFFQNLNKGWYLITYQSQSIGWVKSLGNRFNNYLPKHWRIRMDIDTE